MGVFTEHSRGKIGQGILGFPYDALGCDPDEAVAGQAGLAGPAHDLASLLSGGVEQNNACFRQLQIPQILSALDLYLGLDIETEGGGNENL